MHNSIYINLAEQILPEPLYRRGFDEVTMQFKLEIATDDKVLLEYAVAEDRHLVAVRRLADRQLHALVCLSQRGADANRKSKEEGACLI